MSEMRPGRRTMKLVDFVSRGEAPLRSLSSLRRWMPSTLTEYFIVLPARAL